MQIKDFEAVLAVYRYKSFSEAAYQTNFSVSAISKQIARVENELNVRLFLRKTKSSNLVPTAEGEILIPAIENVMEEYSNLEYLVDNLHDREDTRLTIGCGPLVGTIGENDIITRFLDENADMSLDLLTGRSKEFATKLKSGEIDGYFTFMISVTPEDAPKLNSLLEEDQSIIHIMRNCRLSVGLSADHPLANRDSIRLEEIANETFIFSSFQDYNKYDNRISDLQKILDGSGRRIRARFIDFSNKEIVLKLVESGRGVLPQLVKPLDGGFRIKYVQVEDWNDQADGMFVYRKSNQSKAMKKFLKSVKDYAKGEGLLPESRNEK